MVLLKKLFFVKIVLLKNRFFFNIWRVVKFLIQNLTRRKFFNSKSCFLYLLFRFLLHCYQSGTTCRFMAWCKKIFYECVACVGLTIGTIFLVIAFFMALGFLMGVLIISFALPIDLKKISLEFRKGLVYKDLKLKDTKLLSKLPRPSRKQSTFFISWNLSLVLLTFSILSANTEPLVCVVFVFWKEMNKCFYTFSSRVSFLQCSAFCPFPFFCD